MAFLLLRLAYRGIRSACASSSATLDESAHIVFVGSSIFSFWKNLTTAFAPLPVVNRAWAGSVVSNVIPPHGPPGTAPHLIVFYAGSNDLRRGSTPTDVAARFEKYADALDPGTRLIFVSSLKSPDRASWADRVDAYNAAAATICAAAPGRTYVEVNPILEGCPEYFRWDGIHLTSAGYEALAGVLKPVVEREWAAAQQQERVVKPAGGALVAHAV